MTGKPLENGNMLPKNRAITACPAPLAQIRSHHTVDGGAQVFKMTSSQTKVRIRGARVALLVCSALGGLVVAAPAFAQDSAEDESGIRDIIVTAQKREQSVQDVPVAVTALDATALSVNRVVSVADLSALAPNVTVLTIAGGLNTPNFSIRGALNEGTVAGTDKAVGLYIDGVYIGGQYGSGLDLPSVERIEVLRGPQGTLFGRNSTGGAVGVTTANPKGELGLRQQFTFGNYNQLRSATTVHTPTWGPFSALVSYVHDERDGDMKNIGAGQVWDFSNYGLGKRKAVKTLGAKNAESIFAAVKFAPSDAFEMVYKYDRSTNNYTAGGIGLIYLSAGSTKNRFDTAVAAGRSTYSTAHRPKAVNAEFTLPSHFMAQGHNLTATWKATDSITLKNILGYRKGSVIAFQQFDGMGGLRNDEVNLDPILTASTMNIGRHTQWSDELQINYESDFLTLTAGGIWYSQKTLDGPPVQGMTNFTASLLVPDFDFALTTDADSSRPGVQMALPAGNRYKSHALAGYAQGEVHVTPQLDLVGGLRITQDVKDGVSAVTFQTALLPSHYNATRTSYLLGANFRPTDDIMVYAKYSTGFVAGGAVSGEPFEPESVKAWEGGVKADLFDRRLRLNVALFDSKFRNVQSTASGTSVFPVGDPRTVLPVLVVGAGDLHSKGFEIEATVAPIRGLTLNAAYGYTDFKLTNSNYKVLCSASDPADFTSTGSVCPGGFRLPRRPKATGNLGLQYNSEPLFGDAHLMFRVDGNWRDSFVNLPRLSLITPATPNGYPAGTEGVAVSKAGWVVNSRLALRDIDLGMGKIEVAGWVRNLFDSDRPEFGNMTSSRSRITTSYEAARTFGMDVTFQY